MSPNITITILLITFVLLIITKYPVTFSMIMPTASVILCIQIPVMTLVQRMFKQLNSFSLLTISLFTLMGEIVTADDMSNRLLASTNIRVGQITGGLAHINVLTSMLFGGISGSTTADVSSLGALEVPMIEEAGYEKDFSITVTMASSCQGLVIPFSHSMVLYSMVAGDVSVGSLFCTGYTSDIMLGVFIMGMCYIVSKKRHCPGGKKLPSKEILRVTRGTFLVILAMVIIISGVSAGFFTATELAVVACIYCLSIGSLIYRKLRFRDVLMVLGDTVKTLSMVYALIATASAFGWVMAYLNVPIPATNLFLGVSNNGTMILLLISLVLLLLGYVMNLAPLVSITTPMLLPVVTKFEMDPVQFRVIMMLNLGIGLCTSSVRVTLFTGCAIGNMKIEKASKTMLPLYIPMFIASLLVTFIPTLTMTLLELIVK